MSSFRGGGPTAAPVTTTINDAGQEQCPVCKTLAHFNANMSFLINPECYHPLCNNCVDRLFENGPNQCPYIGCHKTLRKKAFREPRFADLNVEREVDARRRVKAVFNNSEDDFEDLRAYNDYLDMVECLTFDLVYGSESQRATAQNKLQAWEDEHRAEIEKNRRSDMKAREHARKQVQAEQMAAKERRLEAVRQEEEERARKTRQREEDLELLASAPAGHASKIMLKKRGQHRKEALADAEAAAMRRAATAASGGLSIKGLKKKTSNAAGAGGVADEDRGPYDPFGKLDLNPTRYTLKTKYRQDYLDNVHNHAETNAGGYNLQEYYSRALFEAFAGLSVFVCDEKETGKIGLDFREVATLEANMAANENNNENDENSGGGDGISGSDGTDDRSKAPTASSSRARAVPSPAPARGSDGMSFATSLGASPRGDSDVDVQMKDASAATPDSGPQVATKMEVDDF